MGEEERARGVIPGLRLTVPSLGHHPWDLCCHLLLRFWAGCLWSQDVPRGGPHPLSQGASLCPLLPPGARPRGVSSHFHTAPVNPSQEELAGTELMGPVYVEVLPNSPQNPGPAWGHRNLHVYRGHAKVSQRPQLGSHVASQSWSGHGHEVQLPEDSGGCEQLPPWQGASPPDVPESSRYVGTPVELESHQLPT